MRKQIAVFVMILLTLLSGAPAVAQGSGGSSSPAQATELSQHGVSLKPDIIAPLRGLYSNTTAMLRDKDSAAVLDNLQMTTRGIWTSRGIGWVTFNNSSYSGANFYEFGQHTDSSGTNHLLVHVGTALCEVDPNLGTPTTLYTSMQDDNATRASFASFSPSQLLITTGKATAPLLWDGNTAHTASLQSGWPQTVATISYNGPQFLEVFAGRVIYAGFSGRPMDVLFSKQGDPNSFTISSPAAATDGGSFTLPSRLGAITGMKTLRSVDLSSPEVLIIGCQRGMAMITGNSGTNFAMYTLTREYGLASNRSWVQLQNDMYFLATDGIRKFTSLLANGNLLNSSISFPIQDLINRIVKTTSIVGLGGTGYTVTKPIFQQVFALHHPDTQEVFWFLPVDSDYPGRPSHAVVMNYNTQTSATQGNLSIDPIWSTRSGVTAMSGVNFQGNMYTGDNTGTIIKHYASDSYGGTPIQWTYMSPLIPTYSPSQNASLRKMVIITDGPNQQFTASAYTADTLSDGTTQFKARDSRYYSVTASSINNLGTWGSGTTTSYPHLIDFSSTGSGRYWAVRLTGTNAGDHISLVGIQSILTVGGWKQ